MRVALFYFFYLATTGVSLPYFPKYLNAQGFSGKEITAITALAPMLSMVVPLIWGFAADRSGKHARLLKIAVGGIAVSMFPLLFARSFAGIFCVAICYSFFGCAIQTLSDTVAVAEARRIGTDYARLRLWGSISFILTAWGFGQYLSAGGSIQNVPLTMVCLAALSACVVHILRQPAHPPHRVPPTFADAKKLAVNPALLWFFIAGMIHQAGLSPYYNFYGIHLETRGLGDNIVSWSFGIGVAAEVLMLQFFRHIFRHAPLFPTMAFCFVVSSARWLLVAHVTNGPLMAALQALHAFTFAFYYAGSIAHLEQNVAETLRGTGRALFSAISLGFGSVLGHWLAGILKDIYGTPAAFEAAGVLDFVALIPLLIAARYAKNAMSESSQPQEEDALGPDA